MTKDDSLMIKGLAILMMLFLHLFNRLDVFAVITPFVYLKDVPLVYYLSRACGPIPFFLFISGLGLYKSYKNGSNINKTIKRLLKLYVHFWIILTIFLIVGHFIDANKYPGSLCKLLGNYSSLYYTYNSTYWFLAPYALLSLSSIFLFKYFDKIDFRISLIITFIINIFTSLIISKYGKLYLFDNVLLYTPFLFFHFLFPFFLGATCAQKNFFGVFDTLKRCNGLILWGGFFLLIAIRCFFKTSAFHVFYVLAIIILFVSAPKLELIKICFKKLGEHSMNIWLIHNWISEYLFKDYILGLEYPAIILIVLTGISYALSILVNLIAHPIIKYIK